MSTASTSNRHEADSKLVSGYFRIYAVSLLIPIDVIKECLKFFHIVMKWDTYSNHDWIVDPDGKIAELKNCGGWAIIYSSPIIAHGYHHWKMKMVDLPSGNMYLGITTIPDLLNDPTWNHCDRGYFYYWGNGAYPDFCCNSYDSSTESKTNYYSGDIISVIISNGKVSFLNNTTNKDEDGNDLNNEDIPKYEFDIKLMDDKPYYLTATCYVIDTKLELLSYSTVPES